MKWAPGEQRDSITDRPYFYRSDCGNYTVTVPLSDETVYLAYRKAPKDSRLPAQLLGGFETSKAARAACEADQSRQLTKLTTNV